MEATDIPRHEHPIPTTGADTLADAISAKREDGFGGQFSVGEGPTVKCFSCRAIVRPDEVELLDAARLEGASDPADEILVACLRCPRCKALGTAVLNYGPLAPQEHAQAIALFKDARAIR